MFLQSWRRVRFPFLWLQKRSRGSSVFKAGICLYESLLIDREDIRQSMQVIINVTREVKMAVII